MFDGHSVEENWTRFKHIVNTLTDTYIPLRRLAPRTSSPWFNRSLNRLKNKKKRLYRAAKVSGDATRWTAYHSAECIYRSELHKAKDTFFNRTLPSILQTNPKKFWSVFTDPRSQNFVLRGPNGDVIPSRDCANAFNEEFITFFSKHHDAHASYHMQSQLMPMDPLVFDVPGIIKIIERLKLSSASGIDNINSKFLKNTKANSAIILSKLFQQSIDHAYLPSDWKVGKVVPLHKSGNKHTTGNFRPISLTSVPCKILEHIIFRS